MEITMPETILHRVHEIAEKDSMSEEFAHQYSRSANEGQSSTTYQ